TIHPSWWSCPRCQDIILGSQDGAADIAVIEVAEDTPAIPQARVELGIVGVDTPLVKVGWGCEERTNVDPSTVKLGRFKAANARAISASEIRRFDSRISDEQVAMVDASYVITAGHDQDPQNASLCLGDSGGPLYLPNNGDPRVVGVNSDYTFKPPEDDSNLGGVSWTDWHTRTSLGSFLGVGEWLAGLGVNTVNSQSSQP
ncbi:MAG TPA: trypsin-like serine protease, partial [Polyangiaceae bacterium]|nr:trypsin-like serine protease [Polyangiaceae bacterium]